MANQLRRLADRPDLCCINTATLGFRLPISVTIDAIARAGFGAITPWRREVESSDAATVSRQIRDAGLNVAAYCRSSFLPAENSVEFFKNLDLNRRALDEAALLGAQSFVMVVGSLVPGSRDLSAVRMQVEEGIRILLEYARSIGVKLALEPLHPMYASDRSCLNTLEQCLDLIDRAETGSDRGPRHLGVALDVYHVWWDPKLTDQVKRAGKDDRILAFHVCDWLASTQDLLMDRGMMGDGVVDIPGIRNTVEDAGYAGVVEVEIFSKRWWSTPIDEVLSIAGERLRTAC